MAFKAPRKKETPSVSYLNVLWDEEKEVLGILDFWKKELYRHTANGWNGPEFEEARLKCLEQSDILRWYTREIARVKREIK